MNIGRYDYSLPRDLIAQYPTERGRERLLVLDRKSRGISHASFEDIQAYLGENDLLVLNDTRVIQARLLGRKDTGGRAEIFLVRKISPARWYCLVKVSKPLRRGGMVFFENGLTATMEARQGEICEMRFSDPEKVEHTGRVPLPPYIERIPEGIDEAMYQTVYARHDGSVAAPTAGLHFTPEFLRRIGSKGVRIAFVTLHVGPGTFMPVRTQRVEDHIMHEEEFFVSADAASAINEALEKGRRIVAVGTTTTRVIEHLMAEHGRMVPGPGSTGLFIREGFVFKAVGALLTNFHLPCSTLLVLVAAFGGFDAVMGAYRAALAERYRFFSYGDAMFII